MVGVVGDARILGLDVDPGLVAYLTMSKRARARGCAGAPRPCRPSRPRGLGGVQRRRLGTSSSLSSRAPLAGDDQRPQIFARGRQSGTRGCADMCRHRLRDKETKADGTPGRRTQPDTVEPGPPGHAPRLAVRGQPAVQHRRRGSLRQGPRPRPARRVDEPRAQLHAPELAPAALEEVEQRPFVKHLSDAESERQDIWRLSTPCISARMVSVP